LGEKKRRNMMKGIRWKKQAKSARTKEGKDE
jgi:hypothetical protein